MVRKKADREYSTDSFKGYQKEELVDPVKAAIVEILKFAARHRIPFDSRHAANEYVIEELKKSYGIERDISRLSKTYFVKNKEKVSNPYRYEITLYLNRDKRYFKDGVSATTRESVEAKRREDPDIDSYCTGLEIDLGILQDQVKVITKELKQAKKELKALSAPPGVTFTDSKFQDTARALLDVLTSADDFYRLDKEAKTIVDIGSPVPKVVVDAETLKHWYQALEDSGMVEHLKGVDDD